MNVDFWFVVVPDGMIVAVDGLWSGTEERHEQPFIAIVPLSRYKQSDEALD
jgi:hypothetical protein